MSKPTDESRMLRVESNGGRRAKMAFNTFSLLELKQPKSSPAAESETTHPTGAVSSEHRRPLLLFHDWAP